MSEIETFKAKVEQFLAATGLRDRTFGRLACNDSAFVFDLRAGREPRTSTREKVEAFMTAYKAPGASNQSTAKVA